MKKNVIDTLKFTFPCTFPVLTAYAFIGISYGILMNVSGFNFLYPMLISLLLFGGSLQFVAVNLLISPFDPVGTFMITLMLHARQSFYGIAMLEKYRYAGRIKPFLIYFLSDETFSVVYSADIPEDIDEKLFYFFATILNLLYWVVASALGGILGSMLSFNTTGLDFVMTAFFVSIFVDLLRDSSNHIPQLIGVASTLVALLLFGSVKFMIPAMLGIVVLIFIFKKQIIAKGGGTVDI